MICTKRTSVVLIQCSLQTVIEILSNNEEKSTTRQLLVTIVSGLFVLDLSFGAVPEMADLELVRFNSSALSFVR